MQLDGNKVLILMPEDIPVPAPTHRKISLSIKQLTTYINAMRIESINTIVSGTAWGYLFTDGPEPIRQEDGSIAIIADVGYIFTSDYKLHDRWLVNTKILVSTKKRNSREK